MAKERAGGRLHRAFSISMYRGGGSSVEGFRKLLNWDVEADKSRQPLGHGVLIIRYRRLPFAHDRFPRYLIS